MEVPLWCREYREILRILWSAETVLDNGKQGLKMDNFSKNYMIKQGSIV